MPRSARLDYPRAIQTIAARGVAKMNIYRDDDDRAAFLRRLSVVLDDCKTRCLAWALMSNHYHLLLETGPVPLGRVMHRINLSYAQYFNARYDRSGHLFQNRYFSNVVDDHDYLLTSVGYIHLNAVRGGSVPDIEALAHYRWSGHQALMGGPRRRFQDVDWVLALFGVSRAQARQGLVRLLELMLASTGGDTASAAEAVRGTAHTPAANDDLQAQAARRAQAHPEALHRADCEQQRVSWLRAELRRRAWSLDNLVELICECVGADERRLRRGRRTAPEARARAALACLAGPLFAVKDAEIARVTGVSSTSIVRARDRGEEVVSSLGIGPWALLRVGAGPNPAEGFSAETVEAALHR